MISPKHTTGGRAQAGFTMLELTFCLGLFGVVLGLGATIGGSAQDAFKETSSAAQLEAQVNSQLDRVVAEFEHASLGTMNPALTGFANDANSVAFMQVVDIVGGAAVFGNILSIGYQVDPTDPVDGVDNDQDGLIDEGHLVMTRDLATANPTNVTLCRNVRQFLEGETGGVGDENGNGLTDESGFVIERDGDLLTISLTLEGIRSNGRLTTRTSTVSVVVKN